MKFTYEQYAVPYAPVEVREDWQRPEYMFVPDQIVGALHAVLPQMKAYVAAYEHGLETGVITPFLRDVANEKGELRRNRIILPEPSFSDATTIAAASDTLHRLDTDFGRRFDRAVEKGWLEHVPAHAVGLSGGQCASAFWRKDEDGRPATMEMRFDGTVNDPVYVAHEAGHYLAEDYRNSVSETKYWPTGEDRVRTEAQAFFTQIAFYDAALHPDRPATLATTIASQQLGETLSMVRQPIRGFERLAEGFAMSLETRSNAEGEKVLDSAHDHLHRWGHDYGFFIAGGLYQRAKRMSPAERKSFFHALYPSWDRHPHTKGEPPLTSILYAGGVRSENDLQGLFMDGAEMLLGPSAKMSFRHLIADSVPAAVLRCPDGVRTRGPE